MFRVRVQIPFAGEKESTMKTMWIPFARKEICRSMCSDGFENTSVCGN